MSIAKNSKVAKATSAFVSFTATVLLVGSVAIAATDLSGITFSKNLQLGARSADVQNLQKVLNSNAATQIASTGAGSPGLETTYFGALTKAAVIKFQELYASEVLTPSGLTKGTGFVGPASRAKLNSITAGAVVVTPTTPTTPGTPATGTGLTVAAVDQPSNTLAPYNAARIPFTKFRLTAGNDGDVAVSGIVVQRTGLADDASLASVVLVDENGNQVGLEKTLGSDHRAIIGEPMIIKAGQSRTFTVAGNRPAQDLLSGQVVALSVVAINTTATVTGSLPITGASNTINNSLAIGSLSSVGTGATDPIGGTNYSKAVGTTNVTFSSVKLTAGATERVYLKGIRWNQSGSAAQSDLANVKTYVDGVAYDTVLSADGKYYTSNFGSGILIDKGASKDVSIKGDIVGGSGRTIAFDLYRRTDVVLVGETYGYGIMAPAGSASGTNDSAFHAGNPWFDATQFLVSPGTLTVSKGSSAGSNNIAVNTSDQVLGAFAVEVKGEPVTVSSTVFNYAYTGGNASTKGTSITSLTLVGPNGNVVAGPTDGAGANAGNGSVTFGTSITYPIGTGTYVLKGKLSSDFTNGMTVAASTTPSTQWTSATGQTTGNSVTAAPAAAITGNTMTVKSANVTISILSTPAAQSVVSGTQGWEFAQIQLDTTQSGDDVRFASLPVLYTRLTSSTVSPSTNLTNCSLFDKDSNTELTASNRVNPTEAQSGTAVSFIFDNQYTVNKGTTKVLSVRCNVGGTTGSYKFGLAAASAATYQATGVSSNASMLGTGTTPAITVNSGAGNYMALASAGSFTVTQGTASYAIAQAGTADVTVGKLTLHATNEPITLQKMSLILSSYSASSSLGDLTNVSLWNGSTKVGVASFGASQYATATVGTCSGCSAFVLPKDADVDLTIKASLADINAYSGQDGALIQVNYNGNDLAGTQGVGSGSTATINSSSAASTAFAGVRVFKAYPVVTKQAVDTTVLATGTNSRDLYRFSVQAVGGPVSLYKFTVNIATSVSGTTPVIAVKNLVIKGYKDAGYSVPVDGFTTVGQLNTTITTLIDGGDTNVLVNGVSSGENLLKIDSGATYYFRVIGDVTLTGTDLSAQVATKLQGDAAYPASATLMQNAAVVDADTNDNFIWSPNGTTTVAATNNDWTNGYYVPNMQSGDLGVTTLSK